MNDRSPFANLTVTNGSETPQEISIDFRFGYSVSDTLGNIDITYDTEHDEFAITEHVNAFPRNFILEPGQRQTVRLVTRGYQDKSDATYWTRMAILASPVSPPLETTVDEAVAARISFNFEQIIPVFFRRGSVTTGLEVDNLTFFRENNSGRFLFDLKRSGNSPFSGSIVLRITDSNGNEVHNQVSNLTTYFDIRRSITLNASDFEPGDYTAEFTFRSQRRDISRNNLIQIDPVHKTKQFTIE